MGSGCWTTGAGCTLWATYTTLLAYFVGTALHDFPLASILTYGFIATAAIAAILWGDRIRHRVPAAHTPKTGS
jgi:membrane protein DedA with SNARE-associated domain